MSTNNQAAMPKKAMLLAAGEGTRLRPLTNTLPKCMVPIGGIPVLERNIIHLRRYGISDIMINLHYMPAAVRTYFGDGSKWDVTLHYTYEETLLGTAGAVKNVDWFFDAPFILWYGDNLSNCNLKNLCHFHHQKGGIVTFSLHYREDPTSSGIVGLDANDRVTRILEKPRPEQVFSNWVSAAIFVLDPKVLRCIPAKGAPDFGYDILPKLLAADEPMYGYRFSATEHLWWIDTPADYQRIQQEFAVEQKGEVYSDISAFPI